QVSELTYKLCDVSGQQSEWKKWIHCFVNVRALVFLVSLIEYDQMLYEDECINHMEEALTLLDSICNSRWFIKMRMILFLNKIDLFAEKLSSFMCRGDNYGAACDCFLHCFICLNWSVLSKQIYAHYTCATHNRLNVSNHAWICFCSFEDLI
ncbi:guanine nucleotide binding protein, alpha subunit, partial [Ramaria rubella]